MTNKKSRRALGVFTLSMLSVSAILNLRNIPFMASLGMQSIFFYVLAAVLFFLPSAFVSAELSTKFETNGGVFSWVKEAWGEKVGFVAIWMEWINNVIGFPATLSTIIATFTYIAFPKLLSNHLIFFVVMMIILWSCTLYNFLDVKLATGINIVGAILGTIFPGILIIILAIFWIGHGSPIAIHSFNILPKFSNSSFVLFIGAMSGYSGMQILAYHAKDVENPNRTFPRAIIFGGIIILILSILVTLSIAIVVPKANLNIMNGLIEGFAYFFTAFHLGFLTKPLAICLVIGSIAALSAWMLGPARAISVAAEDKLLPKILARKNKNNMPVPLLIFQGIIGTGLASLFLFIPSMQLAFWILIALTSQFTIFMYILIFTSAIKLRYRDRKKPKKGYQIPGGMPFLWVVVLIGTITCIIGFFLGLIPPNLAKQGLENWQYVALVGIGDIIIIFVPLIWIKILNKK